MGRKLYRVALDFSWPKDKIWKGYINPYWDQRVKCVSCDHSGYSPNAKRFQDEWYGNASFDPVTYGANPITEDNPVFRVLAERNCNISPGYYGTGESAVNREVRRLYRHFSNQWAHHLIKEDIDALLKEDRLWDFTRVARTEEQKEIVKQKVASGGNSWLPFSNGYTPTADEINAWSIGGWGHDTSNQHICVKARCAREGVPYLCYACNGDGYTWPSSEIESLYESWKAEDPPVGEGYQLWETTSEGSPQSPVFETLDALCAWCEKNATTFADHKATAEEWREMLDDGFVHHKEGNRIFL
jgi:hypothetical protein